LFVFNQFGDVERCALRPGSVHSAGGWRAVLEPVVARYRGTVCTAYNLSNFMRTLVLPTATEPWSLTSLREKLIKIGAKVISHGRYVTFQMAEVVVPRQMFADIVSLIARLRAPPAPA
jgi:Transposase DDE domain group 1